MSWFATIPFVRILIPFLIGIITAIYIHSNSPLWIWSSCIGLLLFTAETFVFRISSQYRWRYTSGLLLILTLFFLGGFIVQKNSQDFYANHFSRFSTRGLFEIQIIEAPVEKNKSFKLITRVNKVKSNTQWHNTRGKLLCYIEKNASYIPKPGDVLLVQAQLKPIEEAKNPGQFDYKQYLYYHNIFHQTYLKISAIKFKTRAGNWFKNMAFDLRKNLVRSFKNCGLKGDELAVASALLFGETDQLEPGLVRAYAGTGALHVLSVSGLHVAILYGFLHVVLSFLKTRKNGSYITGVVILFSIWFYAFVTGLCPSVLRSSTMFTFIVIGQLLNRQSSVYNSIAASAFILLFYDPFLIMEVGFQLSYLAVIGIIALYPILNRQIQVKQKWLKPVWDISCVSVAAQIATFPLGILYFHQFPNYFLFSNLLVIPLSGIILYTGIVAAAFYFIPAVQFALVYVLEMLLYLLNQTVRFIEQLPFALIEGLSITILEAALCYLAILSWLLWYKTAKPFYIKFLLCFAVLLSSLQLYELFCIHKQQALVVYQVKNHTAIDMIKGRQHMFIADSTFATNTDNMLFNVKHHWDNLNLNKPEMVYTPACLNKDFEFVKIKQHLFFFGNRCMYVADSTYSYKKDIIPDVDILLLRQNPRINLEKLNTLRKHCLVVADGSNSSIKCKWWAKQAVHAGLRFYNTRTNGALVWDFNQPLPDLLLPK